MSTLTETDYDIERNAEDREALGRKFDDIINSGIPKKILGNVEDEKLVARIAINPSPTHNPEPTASPEASASSELRMLVGTQAGLLTVNHETGQM